MCRGTLAASTPPLPDPDIHSSFPVALLCRVHYNRLVGFLGDLTNWYVRLNRSRLKGTDGEDSALTSLAVLYDVLLKMTVIMAPFTPFFAEYLYQHLRKRLLTSNTANLPEDAIGKADSVHYIMLPLAGNPKADGKVLVGMSLLQQVVELGRRAREAATISMKTPVKRVIIVCDSALTLDGLRGELESYVLEELNTWEIVLTSDVETWCSISALPNLPILAKRLGKQVRSAADAIKGLDSASLRSFSRTGSIMICVDGKLLHFSKGDLIVKSAFSGDSTRYIATSSSDGGLTVAVCTVQDDALRRQGITRDFCNRVNKLRKKRKLNIADQVDIFYAESAPLDNISTTRALACNSNLLNRARIYPVDFSSCRGQILISDKYASPGGSNNLSIALAVPAPSLAPAAKKKFAGYVALETLLATCDLSNSKIHGSLENNPFELKLGIDIFPSASSARSLGKGLLAP